ncbi:unnamed protein product, partial [Brassica rapa subsp. narinosa]
FFWFPIAALSLSLSLCAYAGIFSVNRFVVSQIRQMLFAAEGGGFFSSSASGYSNGLALLLLGHKNDQKPVRVSPWSHYHLVAQETDTKFHSDSSKNWLSRRCTSLTCFGRKSDSQPQEFPSSGSEGKKDHAPPPSVDYNSEVSNRFALKSSLKKRSSFSDAFLADGDDVTSRDGVLDHADRRKVQWPDTCGIEIAEVKEFEPRLGNNRSSIKSRCISYRETTDFMIDSNNTLYHEHAAV